MCVIDLLTVVRDTYPTFVICFGGVYHGCYTFEELAKQHDIVDREVMHVQSKSFNDGVLYIVDVF